MNANAPHALLGAILPFLRQIGADARRPMLQMPAHSATVQTISADPVAHARLEALYTR
jgi:hypothetical protein